MSRPRLHLLYDHDCPLCRRFAELVRSWDRAGAIETIDLDAAEADARFARLDLASAREQLTVSDREGQVHQGVEALRQLSSLLPAVRRLTWAYRLPGVTPVVGALYRTVNRHRRRLCLKCGEKWMPSRKSSRQRGRR